MRKRIKRWVSFALMIALVFSAAPAITAKGAQSTSGQNWVNQGNGYFYLEGTDIKVQMANDIIRISGTGAIPDFDYWKLYERPWHTANCKYLMIDETITSIGAYAFYKKESIQHVTIYKNTFIEERNAFEGISYKPIFRITGKKEQTRMIGTIPYTSYDSIKAFAQSNSMGAAYILDDKNSALEFQESVNPTICNVYWAGDKDAPWADVDVHGNGNVATPILKLADVNPDPSLKVSAQVRYQGMACYEAYAAFIGDYTFATTFNVVVEKNNKSLKKTDQVLQYTLTIPAKYRQAGRSFRLLAIGSGVVPVYDDLDTSDSTITFATDEPTTAYALVYK